MNQIQQPANTYDFGLEFNYAVWTQNTVVKLCNVSWNNDYRDIVAFKDAEGNLSRSALNAYIDSLTSETTTITNLSYVKPNLPIRVNVPFNSAYKYNYLRATNPVQPLGGADVQKDYYYFITDVRYIAPNTTELVVQLDVWQTFGYDVTLGNCYIDRGHIGIANENAFNDYGREFLTIPEGFDLGSEYKVVTKRDKIVISPYYADEHGDAGTILVASTVDLNAPPGDAANPILNTAKGSMFQSIASGASYYVWESGNTFSGFMAIFADKPWVTQGIISISMIPSIRRYYPTFVFTNTFSPENPSGSDTPPNGSPLNIPHNMYSNWRDGAEFLEYIPERYHHLKKLFTSPYMVIELTSYTGSPVILKPESWASTSATLVERASLIPPNQRVSFHPRRYNSHITAPIEDLYPGDPGGAYQDGGDDNGDYLDIGALISNFPTLAIVNNGAISYMASNVNSIGFQKGSADWSQQRALRGNEVAYDQATSGISTSKSLTGLGVSADIGQVGVSNKLMADQTLFKTLGSAAGIASSGAGGMGAATQAAVSGGSTLAAVNAANDSLAIRANTAFAANSKNVGNQSFIRDTNKDLADWSARGDYENTIAGINARVQDANLIQPNVSGQAGGDMLNLINGGIKISVRWKMIDHANIKAIGEYWLRYGYAVKQFASIPPSLMVMTKFTYWKLLETYIVGGAMPENFKQSIRGIFEKGVTVWANPNDIGNIDLADNTALPGVFL